MTTYNVTKTKNGERKNTVLYSSNEKEDCLSYLIDVAKHVCDYDDNRFFDEIGDEVFPETGCFRYDVYSYDIEEVNE